VARFIRSADDADDADGPLAAAVALRRLGLVGYLVREHPGR